MKPAETLAYLQTLKPQMLDQLKEWVEIESPSTDKAAVDRFGERVAVAFGDMGMSVEIDTQASAGNNLIARWIGKGPKILLIGHIDTVWEIGTLQKMPFRVENDIAYGPGIYDMKAGIVVALFALQLLREHGLHHSNITFILNSDEEVGSEGSRELIEREARDSACALVLEPAGPDNGLKTKRRGAGDYIVHAVGRTAHAGAEPEKGINALEELSRQILQIQSWNHERKGISSHVTIVQGGSRSNVIPDKATGIVDVRCDTMDDMTWLEQQFRGLKAHHPEARIEIEGGFNRPPFVRSDQVVALYEEASKLAEQFEYPVREYWTGGASDGNFTGAMGIPTLDGLGAEGAGAHAPHEQIRISSLPKRANLLYHLIRKRLGSSSGSGSI